MELGLHPGIIFALAIALFLGLHLLLRWPLPLTFIAVAVATALLGDFGIPFRHLVEGGFGLCGLDTSSSSAMAPGAPPLIIERRREEIQ